MASGFGAVLVMFREMDRAQGRQDAEEGKPRDPMRGNGYGGYDEGYDEGLRSRPSDEREEPA